MKNEFIVLFKMGGFQVFTDDHINEEKTVEEYLNGFDEDINEAVKAQMIDLNKVFRLYLTPKTGGEVNFFHYSFDDALTGAILFYYHND